MPLPTSIKRLFSFTGFQQGQGDNSFPGTNLDADLDQTNNVLNGLLSSVAAILRPDGKIANGAVSRAALGADILVGVGPSKPWSPSTAYVGNADTVTRANRVWLAVKNSVGIDPLTDGTGAYWIQTADLSQAVVVADGSIGTTAFADKAVTGPKLADQSVSSRALGIQVVGRENVKVAVGMMPVGGEIDYAGFVPPPGWVFCSGQTLSRTTYAALFEALSFNITGQTTAGDTRVRFSGGDDLSTIGVVGAAIEGVGVPNGATVTDAVAGSIGLSSAATASGTVSVRIMPYGRGDGSSTFAVPDRRGRVTAGRDNMGGVAAGRFGGLTDGANLAVQIGAPTNVLSNANLPVNLPAGSVQVTYPPHTCYIRLNSPGATQASGTTIADLWQSVAETQTKPPGPQTFAVSQSNPGGGTPFGVLQPTSLVNRIIFAGV